MTDAIELPMWAALLVSFLVLAGAALTLTGCIGLLRLPTFFQRIHAPTLGTTLGTGAILVASMLFFAVAESGPVLHAILIAVFLTVTTPVSFIVLAKATRRRGGASSKPGESNRSSPRT
jgi:multicomponent K+:H+ antiporter subunit G